MRLGTAILLLIVVYLAILSRGFRTVLLILGSLVLGGVWFLVDFGSDKPQTFFYNSQSHPAFLMRAGDSCPADRHVWNGWCVK